MSSSNYLANPAAKKTSLDDNAVFRKLFEHSFSGITLLNQDLKTIYRSPSAERIVGWSAIESDKSILCEITHPHDRHTLNKLTQDVLAYPNKSKVGVFRVKHQKGHYIWIECSFTNLLHDKDVSAIICNFIDVSEKKRAEDKLHLTIKELTAYKHAIDEAAIVAVTDQKGIIQYVNDAFCKISQYTANELIGQDHRIINSGYHSKAFIRNIWVTIAKGHTWKGEIKNKAKDGSYYWVDATIVPFLNEQGKPYRYIAIRTDITQRKFHEEKIIESERFTKTIIDNLPAMISYWTADLQCLFANKALHDWFELKPGEIKGTHKHDLIKNTGFLKCLPYIKKVLLGKPQSFDRAFVKDNGTTIYTHTEYVPDIENGHVKGFYSLVYDITERLNYIRAIESQNKKLTEISWIQSHLIRAPLSRILALAPLIKQAMLDDEDKERMIEYLLLSANELDKVINNISDTATMTD
ncbi:MAG: PAS domain S-box protein [Mucilaginibacter sp.]